MVLKIIQGKHGNILTVFLEKNKGKRGNIDSVKVDDDIITEKDKIANAFNNFFLYHWFKSVHSAK